MRYQTGAYVNIANLGHKKYTAFGKLGLEDLNLA